MFCAVVESGGFTAAARRLGHTPSHVSKQIARLEDALGARLLNRTTRSVGLTDVGARYYERARQILEDARLAQDIARDAARRPAGLLKVSGPVSLGISCLNDWLPEFLAANPDIKLHMEASDRMVDLVAEGFDVVIRAGHLADSALVAKRLLTSRLRIVAAPDYLAKAGIPRVPQDLEDHVLIDYSQRQGASTWEFSGSNGKPITIPVAPRVMCNSAEAEQALAIAGLGITRLPGFACQGALASGRLATMLEDFENPPIGIFAVYPSRSHLSLKVRVFVDFLTKKFHGFGQ